jgi:hypothetical protein
MRFALIAILFFTSVAAANDDEDRITKVTCEPARAYRSGKIPAFVYSRLFSYREKAYEAFHRWEMRRTPINWLELKRAMWRMESEYAAVMP